MPTETKNRTENASRSGRDSSAARWLNSELAHHHASEKGAEREGDVEQLGRAIGDAERGGDDTEREQLARADARHPEQKAREQPPSDHQHENDEGRDFGERHSDDRPNIDVAGGVRIAGAEQAGRRRQQDQQQNRRQILDDEPTDGDAAVDRLHLAALLQRAQQHHGAGAGEREAEDQRRAEMPAPIGGDADAERRGDGHLHHRARRGDVADGKEILEREMQADAEHQQNDADLGELIGKRDIGDEARRRRPDQHAGEQIAD